MTQILYFAIILILVADFGLERYLAHLNIKHSKNKLPDILSDIYDADKYARQQDYFRSNTRFEMLTSSFSFAIIFLMYALGGFGWLDQYLTIFIANDIFRTLVFFGLLFLANDLLTTPFSWYDTFVIEQRFGFNKVTPRIFIVDKLKGYALTIIIGGGLLYLIISIYKLTPNYFWLLAWSAITVFSLFMSMFYSELIVPLFNKQTPLAEGELRTEIEKFAGEVGFKLKNIFVIDSSKRSTKANAYFTGLGPKKRIVLYDTLMDKMTTDEIVAVLAHEIGHYKHKHTLKNIVISLPSTLLLFFILGLMLKSDTLAQALGGSAANFHLNVLAFGIIYSPVSLILNLITNQLSRRYEYQADNYAASHGFGTQLISGLKKLSSTSLSNLTPHPLYVFLHYSHPTLYQRIKNITT
ncbi:MAG: M48 family metallopeptidase [Bacteroidales bacterium]|nr:M48 family metallopeptidase [Bacteroidales bacterium]